MIFVCDRCEYEFEADKKPDLCPICYAPMHHLIPKTEQSAQDGKMKRPEI